METTEPAYLPWQAPLLERALDLKARRRLPQAVIIDDDSQRDCSGFVHYLASLLLCDRLEKLSPCGTCDACRMMRAGTYADYAMVTLEIDPKSKKISKNIKIEQIRKLIHEVSLTHQYTRPKIAAIYPAEDLSRGGANAFLKTLEEPAAGVMLILATHNRGRIPITLRSRCQIWRLGLPSRAAARAWLSTQQLSAEEAGTYLDFAGGDPLLALDLREQGYADLVADFKQRFGNYLRGRLAVSSLCQHLKAFDTRLLRRLIEMTLNAYCYRSSGVDSAGNPVDDSDPERAQRLLELRSRAQIQLRIEENNLDLQLQLEDVLISLKQILTRRTV